MKNKKAFLKKILILVSSVSIVFLSALFLSGCLSPSIPEITLGDSGSTKTLQSTISVSGRGSVKMIPDEVSISIAVIIEKPNSQEAVDQNSQLSDTVIEQIKSINAENLSIQTIGYELYPLYNYSNESTPPEIYAYRATSTIEVKTTELERIGEIIAKATEAGASTISSIGFDLTDATRRTAKNDALSAATIDANDKAIAIANAMGLKIDTVLYIVEEEVSFPQPFMAPAGMGDLKTEAVSAPTILPQEIEVAATINVAYLFIK